MLDLEAASGLPLKLADDGTLEFGGDLPVVKPAVRTLDAMRPVLLDPEAKGPEVVYYMYRDVGFAADKARFHAHGLRYDITVLVPAKLGQEWNKTFGHYHPKAPGGAYYPEVYEVIAGKAVYALQHKGEDGRIDDVLGIPASPGDKVFMLPGYGHATINIGDTPLVMANWVAGEFESEYGDYKERHGAAYYALEGTEAVRWQPNPRYDNPPEVRVVAPLCPQATTALRAGRPMYPDGCAYPDRLGYLLDANRYRGEWGALVS
jgi:glucose-6-phosphate isomerase